MADSLNEQTIRLLEFDTTKNQVVGVYVIYLNTSLQNWRHVLCVGWSFLAIEQNGKMGAKAFRRVMKCKPKAPRISRITRIWCPSN